MVLELLLIPFLTFQGRGIPKLEKIMHLHSVCMKYRTANYFSMSTEIMQFALFFY